jgi:hypothetical protein
LVYTDTGLRLWSCAEGIQERPLISLQIGGEYNDRFQG